MDLQMHKRLGIVAMSLAAPERLARAFLRPQPQPMALPEEPAWEPIAFQSRGVTCRGWWVKPESGAGDRVVVVAHGWTSHLMKMACFLETLLETGHQVMLYNARSHGNSDPWPTVSMAQFAEDAMAAVHFARTRVPRVVLLGHSMGGGGSVVAVADGAPVEALVVLAPPAHPVRASQDLLIKWGVPQSDLVMRRILPHVQKAIGRTFDSLAPERRIAEITCPVLLIQGSADPVIAEGHFRSICQQAGPNVETLVVEGADHDTVKTAPEALARIREFLART